MSDIIKVHVKPIQQKNVRVSEGISKNGKPYRMASQNVWLFIDDEYPTEFQMNLPDGLQSYESGFYKLTMQSFKSAIRIGTYGAPILSSQRLIFYPYDDDPIVTTNKQSMFNKK